MRRSRALWRAPVRRLAAAILLALATAPATDGTAGDDVDRGLEEAARALAEGRLQESETAILTLLARDPAALADCEDLAARLVAGGGGERLLFWLLRRAETAQQQADAARAEALLAAASRIAPRSGEVWFRLGRTRVLARRFPSAVEPLATALRLGRTDLATRLYLGSALWESARLDEAEEVLRAAVLTSGRAAPAVQELGRLLLWRGRYGEAAALLAEVAAARPAAGVELDLARALEGAERLDEALASFRRAVAAEPQDSRARWGLGRLLLRLGERQAAEAELAIYRDLYRREQEAVRQAGLLQARIDRGRELLAAGDPQAAIEHLAALPETAESLLALALAQRAAGELAAAIAALERAVALAPDRADLRSRLSELRLGDDDS